MATSVALSVGLLLGGGGWALTLRSSGCDDDPLVVTVAADPAVAGAASAVAERLNTAERDAGRCATVKILATGSADAAAAFQIGRNVADAWLPDSSLWIEIAATGPRSARAVAAPSSVAYSPLLFAMSPKPASGVRQEAARRSWEVFVPESRTAGLADSSTAPSKRIDVPRLRLPDPAASASGMAALLALQQAAGGSADAIGAFTGVLRTAQTVPPALIGDLGRARPRQITVLSEQAIWQRDRPSGTKTPVVYPAAGTPYLDFPFAIRTTDPAKQRAAKALLSALRSADGARELRRQGLRVSVDQTGGRPEGGRSVADSAAPAPRRLAAPQPGAGVQIAELWRRFRQGINILAVIDTSATAGRPIKGRGWPRGASRLDAMRGALATGFSLVGDDSRFGLWTLEPPAGTAAPGRRRPYRALVPLDELGARTENGGTQRLRLQQALGALRPGRQTSAQGLIPSVVAAYHAMERGYDKDRLNAVLVLTPGGSLARDAAQRRALNALRTSCDPARPVSVIVMSFGTEPAPALRDLASVTDGGTFTIDGPDAVMRLFLRSDALRVGDHRCPG